MSFDTTKRYFAFNQNLLGLLGQLRAQHGGTANTAPNRKGKSKGVEVETLICALDNTDTGAYRAGVFGESIMPIRLTDGRLCIGGYWTTSSIAAFESGSIKGEELTMEQVKALQPVSEI